MSEWDWEPNLSSHVVEHSNLNRHKNRRLYALRYHNGHLVAMPFRILAAVTADRPYDHGHFVFEWDWELNWSSTKAQPAKRQVRGQESPENAMLSIEALYVY